MFSLMPNLGLLSRERAQLLPFLFAPLIAAETARRRAARLARMTPGVGWPYSQDRALSARRPRPKNSTGSIATHVGL